MKSFFERFAAKKSLQESPVEVRLEKYRKTRAQVGRLEIEKIIEPQPNMMRVSVRAQGGRLLELSFEFESAEPHGLLEILCIEQQVTFLLFQEEVTHA